MFEKLPLSRLLRYGYGGFLLVGIVSLIEPEIVKLAVEATGSIVSPFVIFFVGTCIFVVYRYVLGEFILYRLTHAIHGIWDRCFSGEDGVSSPTGYLGSLGISWWQRRVAYNEIRRGLFKDEQRERLDLAHSEIHIVYITAVELIATWLYLRARGNPYPFSGAVIPVAAVLTLIAAIVADIGQHRIEYRLLRYGIESDKLREFLHERGFIVRPSAAPAAEKDNVEVVQMKPIELRWIENRGDLRGDSYYIPREAIDFVEAVDEIHFATILPNAIRGNHYHIGKKELILLIFSDSWRLAWAPLEAVDVTTQNIEGEGAILIKVQPKIVHAIKNTGRRPIHLASFSRKRYDPENPDTFQKVLLT
jgi:hypothetical protein